MADSRVPGLRTQIVLALAGLMLLSFVPLFFAVASLTRATLRGARENDARALGRAVAAHVADAETSHDAQLLKRRLESDIGTGGVEAVCIYDAERHLVASAGDPAELAVMHAPAMPYGEAASTVHGANGRALDVVVPHETMAVLARLRTDDDADQAAPLVRLVALYMTVFAFALLVFAYFALTRLIVRPIEGLVRAAERVASGARAFPVPRTGASEIVELGQSVQKMTTHLIADDNALRAKVEELTLTTRRLSDTRTQLARSDRLASVGRLAAGIAHEIGNPLAAIMGMQDLLLAEDPPQAQARDFVLRMKRETERIHLVLRDLLDFARPEKPVESGGTPPAPADVRSVAVDVVGLTKHQKSFRSIEIATEIEPGELCVALSAQRLTQVLLNLVLNAGDAIATAKGSGHVAIRAAAAAAAIRIEVEDDGPGVAPEVRERIFEPFATTKEVGAGTGLGLAVCRGLVESAGGEITVDESYTKGARFVVILPRARAA